MLDNNIINEKQAAYLPKDSTTNQLLYIVHQIKASWAKNQISHACFLDISAAFDAVWHNALLAKLKQLNIIGKPLELLRSYLNNRKAKVVVDGAESEEQPMDAGVISIFKTHFKHLLLSAAIKASEGNNMSFIEFLKKVTILDAIRLIGVAWSKVPNSAMHKVWKKLMPTDDPTPLEIDSTHSKKSERARKSK